MYVYRSNRVIKIRDGETEDTIRAAGYFERHPDTVVCKGNPPTIPTLERWMDEGICKAIDGCRVEPDGTCQHGKPSWLLALHMI